MTKSFLNLAFIFLITSAFKCVNIKIRDLKQIDKVSAEKNDLQIQGWTRGDSSLGFDFAFSAEDLLQIESLKNPNQCRIKLIIDTTSYKENEGMFINGNRQTFSRTTKKGNVQQIVLTFDTNYTYKQIKKNGYPITLTVEEKNELKNINFTF